MIPQIAALSAIDVVKGVIPNIYPKIKWINDIIVDNKKIAGILCQSFLTHSSVDCIIGIGLNVNGKIDC